MWQLCNNFMPVLKQHDLYLQNRPKLQCIDIEIYYKKVLKRTENILPMINQLLVCLWDSLKGKVEARKINPKNDWDWFLLHQVLSFFLECMYDIWIYLFILLK